MCRLAGSETLAVKVLVEDAAASLKAVSETKPLDEERRKLLDPVGPFEFGDRVGTRHYGRRIRKQG